MSELAALEGSHGDAKVRERLKRGAFTISIDLEMAWGIWDKPSKDYFRLCAEREARIVDGLLDIFDRRQVSATWAVVGRLLSRASKFPVETEHGDRIWYGPALVDRIRQAKTKQDVGSHSFAHVYFGAISRDEAHHDLEAARDVHKEHGLDFTSFVFPRNQVGYVDVLEEVGIRVFRSLDQGWFMHVGRLAGRVAGQAANLADKMVPVPPRPVEPRDHVESVELPSSMLLLSRNGLRRLARPEVVIAKTRLGLAAAKRKRGVFHLWFHPSNFYYETDRQLRVIDRTVEAASTMRDRGEIDIVPMSHFA